MEQNASPKHSPEKTQGAVRFWTAFCVFVPRGTKPAKHVQKVPRETKDFVKTLPSFSAKPKNPPPLSGEAILKLHLNHIYNFMINSENGLKK